jgi:NADH-quinone oxidoreductase subunit J
MEISSWIFGGFAFLALAGAIALLFVRNLMYAVLALFVVLVAIAALFVFVGAEFLAISQLIIYIGGILILMIVGLMLTRRNMQDKAETGLIQIIPAIFLFSALVALFILVFFQQDWNQLDWMKTPTPLPTHLNNVQHIGIQTLTTYLIPFELISILLLLVLIGATYIARKDIK